MAIYSRYGGILESSGKAMGVRAALGIINQTLTEVLTELEDDFDDETRWSIAWFEQYGFEAGDFGDAELLSKAKVTSVSSLHNAGIVVSRGGKVRLVRPAEMSLEWAAQPDRPVTAWEMGHHIIRDLEAGGEGAAAALVVALGGKAEIARELAYRLYTICERKKRAAEAQSYNALVPSWPEIIRLAREAGPQQPAQGNLLA